MTKIHVWTELIKLSFTSVRAFHLKMCYQNHVCALFWDDCYREKYEDKFFPASVLYLVLILYFFNNVP